MLLVVGLWLIWVISLNYNFIMGLRCNKTYLGKSCSFGLLRVPFVNCRQFMYLVISLLVLRAGCGIWLYQFPIIAYHFTTSIYRYERICKMRDWDSLQVLFFSYDSLVWKTCTEMFVSWWGLNWTLNLLGIMKTIALLVLQRLVST